MDNEQTGGSNETPPAAHHKGLKIHSQARHDLIDALNNATVCEDDVEFVHVHIAPRAAEKLTLALADLTGTCLKRGQTDC